MSARARSISVQCSRKWDSKFVTTSSRINVRHLSPDLRARTKNYRSALPDISIPFRWAYHRGPKDAFAVETDGDKLYGRGTSDIKSGVAAMTVISLPLPTV